MKSTGKPSFISTIGTDIAASSAGEYFGTDDYVANELEPEVVDGWRGPRVCIRKLKIFVRDGHEKLKKTGKMLERFSAYNKSGKTKTLKIENCLVIGNDKYDHEMMRAAKLSAASPLADEETKRIADYWITSYSRLKTDEFLVSCKSL